MDAGFDGARGSVSVFFAQLFFSLLVFGSLSLSLSLSLVFSFLLTGNIAARATTTNT